MACANALRSKTDDPAKAPLTLVRIRKRGRFPQAHFSGLIQLTICCHARADEALVTMRSMMSRLKLTVNETKTRACRLLEEKFDFALFQTVNLGVQFMLPCLCGLKYRFHRRNLARQLIKSGQIILRIADFLLHLIKSTKGRVNRGFLAPRLEDAYEPIFKVFATPRRDSEQRGMRDVRSGVRLRLGGLPRLSGRPNTRGAKR